MGDWFQTIVDRDVGEDEAPALAAAIRDWLVSEGIIGSDMTDNVLGSDLGYPPGYNQGKAVDEEVPECWTNGFHIIIGRSVFDSGAGEIFLVCAECGDRSELTDAWSEAIGEWHSREGPGLLSCIRCNHTRTITEWQHDPPWGFGNLGFQFWNWPPLKESFIEEVSRRLGHRVILVEGKI